MKWSSALLFGLLVCLLGTQGCYRTIVRVKPGVKYEYRDWKFDPANETRRYVNIGLVYEYTRPDRIVCRQAPEFIRLERSILYTLIHGAAGPFYSPWKVEAHCAPERRDRFVSQLLIANPDDEKLQKDYAALRAKDVDSVKDRRCPKAGVDDPNVEWGLAAAYNRDFHPAASGEKVHVIRVKEARRITGGSGLMQKAVVNVCVELLEDPNDPVRCRIREPVYVRSLKGADWSDWQLVERGRRDDGFPCANMK